MYETDQKSVSHNVYNQNRNTSVQSDIINSEYSQEDNIQNEEPELNLDSEIPDLNTEVVNETTHDTTGVTTVPPVQSPERLSRPTRERKVPAKFKDFIMT